jgi:hypothetical protein
MTRFAGQQHLQRGYELHSPSKVKIRRTTRIWTRIHRSFQSVYPRKKSVSCMRETAILKPALSFRQDKIWN